MSILTEIREACPEVETASIVKSDLHGEDAVKVTVYLNTGKKIVGKFAKHPREGFGGVVFKEHKDVAGLMIHKIQSVLRGTAE